MRRLALSLTLLVLAALAAAVPAGAATKAPPLPKGFVGVNGDGPLFAAGVDIPTQLGRMKAVGLAQLRLVFDWASVQPTGPGTSDFSGLDAVVGAAARQGLSVLPVVIHAPGWAADTRQGAGYGAPPRDPATYGAFLTALVNRYGPRGSFWVEHPELPRAAIRRWQLWNEPNLPRFWTVQPFARSYAGLVKAADKAIDAADPGAQVVLGGLTNGVGSPSWEALGQVYAAGAGGHFDVIAVHPYTGTAARVLETLRRVRAAARAHGGARTPIALTELSWSSGGGGRKGITWDTTEAGQARKLSLVFTAIARNRTALRITSAFWYTWVSPAPDPKQGWEFFAGLNKMQGGRVVAKPALDAMRLTIRRLTAR